MNNIIYHCARFALIFVGIFIIPLIIYSFVNQFSFGFLIVLGMLCICMVAWMVEDMYRPYTNDGPGYSEYWDIGDDNGDVR